MFTYIARRIVYVIPIVLGVALLCFMLVHITPGDPLVAILPADASQELANQLRAAYGLDRPLPVQKILRRVRLRKHVPVGVGDRRLHVGDGRERVLDLLQRRQVHEVRQAEVVQVESGHPWLSVPRKPGPVIVDPVSGTSMRRGRGAPTAPAKSCSDPRVWNRR